MKERRRTPASGFADDGQSFSVEGAHALANADGYLFNDTLYFQIDARGRCSSYYVQPDLTFFSGPLRCFYIRDDESGAFWTVPFEPVRRETDRYVFTVSPACIAWMAVVAGIEVSVRVVVPRRDPVELWTVRVANRSPRRRKVSVYSCFPTAEGGLSSDAQYDERLNGMRFNTFPYYVRVEQYLQLRDLTHGVFCASDKRPTAYEFSVPAFEGGNGLHNPVQLRRRRLANGICRKEPASAVLQYARTLAPQKTFEANFVFGPARDRAEMLRLQRRYLARGGIEKAIREVESWLRTHTPAVSVKTPDRDLNHFVNHWLPRQTLLCGGAMRQLLDACARNALQDAMGITYNAPGLARKWFLAVLARQETDGWLPHSIPLVPNAPQFPINTIPHRDMNAWTAPSLGFYILESGDFAILEEQVPFHKGRTRGTVYEHVCRGLDWLLNDRSPRGLSRIGEGDWNDPLNMAGHGGKGESVWLTEALVHALDIWSGFAARRGDRARAMRYRREADRSRRALNRHAWDGGWYVRGTTDAGRPFGSRSDREGRIFLNAQSWAIISGTADGKRREACIRSVQQHLWTDSGPRTLYPPFTSMREDIGKLTQKTGGTGENGSVYVHAALFYAYSLYLARRPEEGFVALRTLLAGGIRNACDRARQLPLYLPNAYEMTCDPRREGASSRSPKTGSCAWFYRIVVADLLGVRAEPDGLRIDPQLPARWKTASLERTVRGAHYSVRIRRNKRCAETRVALDGNWLDTCLVPFQRPGTRHRIDVRIPA